MKWYAEHFHGHAFVYDEDGKFVGSLDISHGFANLYLVLAAPELLNNLKKVLNDPICYPQEGCNQQEMKLLYDKAKQGDEVCQRTLSAR